MIMYMCFMLNYDIVQYHLYFHVGEGFSRCAEGFDSLVSLQAHLHYRSSLMS